MKRFFLLLAWVMLAAWLIPGGRAAASPAPQAISADAFWQLVDDTLAWLESGPLPDPAVWQPQVERWSAIREVTLPGGQAAPVDTGFIINLMQRTPPAALELEAYLLNLKQSRALTTPPGGERELELLREILARPEFQAQGENIIQRIYRWLLEQFWRLVDLLFGDLQGSVRVPPELSITLSLVVLLAVLAFVFRDTLRSLFSSVELAEESAGEGEVLSARLAGQKAQALSGSGDYRHALRYLYLSALLTLDERGLLRYNRAQTNREYLRQVRSRPELAEHLRVVVDTFDRVWYGYQPVDEASYARYAEHVRALEETKE